MPSGASPRETKSRVARTFSTGASFSATEDHTPSASSATLPYFPAGTLLVGRGYSDAPECSCAPFQTRWSLRLRARHAIAVEECDIELARPDQQVDQPPIRFRDRKPVDPRDQHRDRPPRALPSAMEDKIQILSMPRFAVAVSSQSCRARCDRTFARRWVAEAAIAGAIRLISLAKPSSSTRRPYSLFVHQRCHLSGKPFQTLDALCNGLAATIED
jgi:hypothetical protein